jgi:site-specific DNA-cytosine methylase
MVKSITDDKAHCLTASMWKGQIPTFVKKPIQVGEATNIKGFDVIKRVYSPEGKSPTLTTMQGGHREPKVAIGRVINRRLDEHGVRKDNQKELPFTPQIEISDTDKSNCLTTVQKDNVVVQDELYRKLTPLECERLQTVPDNYTNHVSKTQRYKMLGNGWTVDVVAHIFGGINE